MYGFLISSSILISILITEWLVKRDKKDTEIIWNLASITIIFGIIGARLYHVIDYWNYYSTNLNKIFYIWEGGLGIFGAIILGSLAAYLYLKIKQKNFLYYISVITTVLPLAQAIGRWGNYFNKEMYGKVTTLPWGIYIEGVKHHPLFAYESILNIILFITLLKVKLSNKTNPKKLIGVYLGGYGSIRFFLEFLKNDAWTINGLNIAQLISIIFLGLSYILISKKELPNDIPSK